MEKILKSIKFPGLDDVYVIPEGGEGNITIDLEGSNSGEANPINADTLGGILAKDYATVSNVNEKIRKAAPRNLLDNSDFRNPVNQRGQTSYLGHSYSIDRWQVNSYTTLTIMDDFCRLSGHYNLWQIVPVTLKAGKTYTCAARIKASEGIRDGWLLVEASVDGTRLGVWSKKISDWTIAIVNFTPDSDLEAAAIQLTNSGDTSVATDIEWIALYEGEYTIDTLPEYQPKGYGAELAECQRYYRHDCLRGISGYVMAGGQQFIGYIPDCEMRTTPTLTLTNMDSVVIEGDAVAVLGTNGATSSGNGCQILLVLSKQMEKFDVAVTANVQGNLSADL